jgi:hypothetical protein
MYFAMLKATGISNLDKLGRFVCISLKLCMRSDRWTSSVLGVVAHTKPKTRDAQAQTKTAGTGTGVTDETVTH